VLRKSGQAGYIRASPGVFHVQQAHSRRSTGAAGQIGYSLLFRDRRAARCRKNQPVILQMLEIPDEKAQKALKGVMMELDDCAFPLLHGMIPTATRWSRSRTSRIALLVGERPRGPGMERRTSSEANGQDLRAARQGARRGSRAARSGCWWSGNPANTNCLIAMRNAPSLNRLSSRDDAPGPQSRSRTDRAEDRQSPRLDPQVTIWENHSATQYPDVFQAEAAARKSGR